MFKTKKHTLLAGLRRVVTFGSSSRSGGSPWAARALAANSDTCSRGPAGGYAVYLECLVWPRLSQAPEPLAISHHRSLGHNIVHNPETLVIQITRKLRVLHVVSAGNCQSPCPGRLKHRKAGWASQVGPLCAARRRWFLGAAMSEVYPLILVCTGELPAGGFSAEGVLFHSWDHRLCSRGSVVMDLTNPAKIDFAEGQEWSLKTLQRSLRAWGLYKMFWVGGVLQCMPAVPHSIGQTFPNTASASGECLATAVEGGRGTDRAP